MITMIPSASERPLAHPRTDRPETSIYLPRRRAKDERDDSISCDFDVLERAQDVNLTGGHKILVSIASGSRDMDVRVSENDTRSACILDSELGLAVLACDAT